MAVSDMIPGMDNAALASLHANILRLREHGDLKQQEQAAEMLPLVEAELAVRKAKAPAKRTKAASVG